jgi:cbb3-type cytochrome oxidase subunit 3
MLSNNLSNIEGVSIFPLISLILFFLFFAATIIWVLRLDKKYIVRMGNLPLESKSKDENNSEMKDEVNQ